MKNFAHQSYFKPFGNKTDQVRAHLHPANDAALGRAAGGAAGSALALARRRRAAAAVALPGARRRRRRWSLWLGQHKLHLTPPHCLRRASQ